MHDIIKFPHPDNKVALPTVPLISLMKARSFREYNQQFVTPLPPLYFITEEFEAGIDKYNSGCIQRAVDFLNRDNAQVLVKNRLMIAHKMPDSEIKLWSQTIFCQFYKGESFLFRYRLHGQSGKTSETIEITKLWLRNEQRRRYNSYEEYLKS
jgi:hypothetical protein